MRSIFSDGVAAAATSGRSASARLLRDERAVQEEQRLLRNGRYVAHRRMLIRRSEVKRVQQSRNASALDKAVDRTARRRGLARSAGTERRPP